MSDLSARCQEFVDSANRGELRGASRGESAARQLAMAVVEHWPSLDVRNKAGFIEFLQLAGPSPSTARDLIRA